MVSCEINHMQSYLILKCVGQSQNSEKRASWERCFALFPGVFSCDEET